MAVLEASALLPSRIILLPIAACCSLVGWVIYTRYFHPLAAIPGPFFASISRLWIALQLKGGDFEVKQRVLHAKYGPIIRIAPNEVAISDPAALKTIYGIKSGYTKVRSFSHEVDTNYFTMMDEKLHASRRRITNSIYSMSSVLESEPYIDLCSELFVERMGEYADQGVAVDFGQWLQMYAFDVIGELYFGNMFGFMKNRHDYGGFIESLDVLLPPLIVACVLPSYARFFLPIAGEVLPSARSALQCLQNIVTASENCVLAREQELRAGKVARKDILAKLFDIRDKKGDEVDFTSRHLQQECYVAIFAGSDTTAIALRAVFHALMCNPGVYTKLMEEIDTATEEGRLSSPNVQYAEATKLPYLNAVIKEAMRLHPSVAMTMPRHVPMGGATLADHFIPEGYRVGMNPAVIHYDTTIFGDDAAEFKPDRWFQEDAANMDRYMLHFGAGARTCLGKNISLSEIHKMVPQFLRQMEIELVDGTKELKSENFWFNKQVGLKVKLRRRKPSA
ncbi:cytochrome P450 oxidoreductase [Bisporella sp. PMI_857]|nr:cytochrome P450 oxidoreductase [Bisporella sp. PMI_857]